MDSATGIPAKTLSPILVNYYKRFGLNEEQIRELYNRPIIGDPNRPRPPRPTGAKKGGCGCGG